MPRTKPTPLLSDLCLQVSSAYLFDSAIRGESANCQSFLSSLPPKYAVSLVEKVVQAYAFHNITDVRPLLESVALSTLTQLDLNALTRINNVSKEKQNEFSSALLSAIAEMPALEVFRAKSKHAKYPVVPVIEDVHLEALGRHCPRLRELDVSFNKKVTGRGILALVEGCKRMQKLLIFDVHVYYKDLAFAALNWPSIAFFGSRDTGKILKQIYQDAKGEEKNPLPQVALSHVNNLGHQLGRHNFRTRSKKAVIEAIAKIAPTVQHIKVLVTDNDAGHLTSLTNLRSAELIFAKGSNQGPETFRFLQLRGENLTTLTVMCNNYNLHSCRVVGEHCPNLQRFWCRCNNFNSTALNPTKHEYFTKLELFSLRVGCDKLSVSNLAPYVFPYVIQNASKTLKELFVAVRSPALLTDHYVQNLILDYELFQLETFCLVMPGANDREATFPDLTVSTADFLLRMCPNISSITNLFSWDVSVEDHQRLVEEAKFSNYDIRIKRRKD